MNNGRQPKKQQTSQVGRTGASVRRPQGSIRNAKVVGGSSAKGTSLERKLTEDDIADLKETFNMFDKDGGGTISQSEFKSVMEHLGMKISDADVIDVIKSVDENFDGEIDFDEGMCIYFEFVACH